MHAYPGPPTNVVNMQPRTQLSSAFFIPNELRNDILARNEIANMIEPTPNPGKLSVICAYCFSAIAMTKLHFYFFFDWA